ncbi:PmoA family protein [Belliella marina]|uniref:PmoA family protein n=1 Tax=Belliella marina TaxID=1644146 RepID=A0ABW4VGW2_9BACT
MKNTTFIILLALWLQSCGKPDILITIDPGSYDRIAVPISISLNAAIEPTGNYLLEETKSGKKIPVEILDSLTLIVFVDSLESDIPKTYRLIKNTSNTPNSSFIKILEDQKGIRVQVDDKELFYYQKEMAFPPNGKSKLYAKNGFIHPLKSPNGAIVTDDFPAGHMHQHALYNAWVNTKFKGKKVDFWNQLDSLGTVAHKDVLSVKEGQTIGQIISSQSHISMENGEILEEKWDIRIYPVSDFFMFDIYSEQTNTSSDTLFLEKYIYGGMALRGSREWNPDDSLHFQNPWEVLSDQGFTLENVNHTKAKWISVSGKISGSDAGVTVFGFPDNFRYPQTVRVHPSMPYWVFSPVVDNGFTIAPGETYISKFRYFVHDGKPDKNMIENIQRNLENPVTVTVN